MENGDKYNTLVLLNNGSWTLKFLARTVYMLMQDMFDPISKNLILSELYKSAKYKTPPQKWVLKYMPKMQKALLFDGNIVADDIANIILSSCLCNKNGDVISIIPPFAANYCEITQ